MSKNLLPQHYRVYCENHYIGEVMQWSYTLALIAGRRLAITKNLSPDLVTIYEHQ